MKSKRLKKSLSKSMKVCYLICLCFVFLCGCGKYEDGGIKREAQFNIISSWKISTYSRTGVSGSDAYLSNYEEIFEVDSIYVRSYIDSLGNAIVDSGKWYFTDQLDFIRIIDTDSFITNSSDTLGLYKYKIQSLTLDEFRYVFYQNDASHFFKMEPSLE